MGGMAKVTLTISIFRIGIGVVLLYAGAIKALDPRDFMSDIVNYRILPYSVSAVVALYLPWLEIFCGLSLLTKRFLNGGLAISAILMGVFTITLLSAWARGLDISCGCFGTASTSRHYPWLIGRDVIVLVMIGVVFIKSRNTNLKKQFT